MESYAPSFGKDSDGALFESEMLTFNKHTSKRPFGGTLRGYVAQWRNFE